jgi:hypothetical protein
LPYVADKIKERYPTVTFISREEFTMGTNIDNDEDAAKAAQSGADAMIDAYGA